MDLSNFTIKNKTKDEVSILETSTKDVAIIGIALRLPMADNKDEFWDNLRESVDCVRDFPESRKQDAEAFAKLMNFNSNEIKFNKGSYLDYIDNFDYNFFNISPKEASLMSPEQKIFLEIVWQAIEDAGYCNGKLQGSTTGLYLGYSGDALFDYKRLIEKIDPELLIDALPGNLSSIIPSRISYLLDLKGPAMCIDTACSSSLVAVHQACQALRNNDCDYAIAGGVKLNLLPIKFRKKLGIESSDGRARTFDNNADGTGMGEGVAAILLKPLHKAKRDGDRIYSIIKGSAVNQDGRSIGITAPNAIAQAEVIKDAWEDSCINPETISYIEAHGTGTKLGDPIEIDGITKAYANVTNKRQFCAIGSVKTNIGHLDSAAGIIGLIKATLALKNNQIPASLHFKTPNNEIDFENSPVYVNNKLANWNGEFPRRCGVSAFGLSGTNCHIILEEANESHNEIWHNGENLLVISAKTEESLISVICNNRDYIKKSKEINLNNYCHTYFMCRNRYNHQVFINFSNRDELLECLDSLCSNGLECSEDNKITYSKGINDTNKINEMHIIWSKKYSENSYKKLSVPCYPFVKSRSWLSTKDENNIADINDIVSKLSNNPELIKTVKSILGVENSNDSVKNNDDKVSVILRGRNNHKYTTTEKQMAEIWSDALGYTEFDIDADFYDLGGDSIISFQIINSYDKKHSIRLEQSSILEYGTIREISSHIDSINATNNDNELKKDIKEFYPLTTAQNKMYILDKFEGIGTSYNMPVAISIKGKLDIDRVKDCIKELVYRHSSFRTSFHMVNNIPKQKIHNDIDFTINYYEKKENENINDIVKSCINPFDLTKAPLFRAFIIKIEFDKHIILFDSHHIITDGTSSAIFDKELIELYYGKTLEPISYEYADYSIWQENQLNTTSLKAQKDYWLKQFAGELPVLNFPTDYKRQNKQSFAGDRVLFEADQELTTKILKFAKSQGATLFMVLMSAYKILLSKYTGQDDLIVATPVSGRKKRDFENIIGMFVNTIALRSFPTGTKSFTEYLQEMKSITLDAYDNSDYPIEDIVTSLNLERDLSRNPLFDTMLTLQNTQKLEIEVDGLEFKQVEFENNISKFDLNLNISLQEDRLKFDMEYCTSLFKKETITKLSKHFLNLFKDITSNPDKIIRNISILEDCETKTLLESFNNTDYKYPNTKTVHSFIEKNAEKTPDSIAVIYGKDKLTYKELNVKSNQVAAYLQKKGVEQGDIVPINMDRSLEFAIGMIGVLKAGGAFLPIDPVNPDERLKFMIEDSKAKVVLTCNSYVQRIEKLDINREIISLEDQNIYSNEAVNLKKRVKASDLAYVIYTSGSTGKPKGVMIKHQSLVNFVYALNNEFLNDTTNSDNCMSLTSISFDVSICEIYYPLIFGSSLVFYDKKGITDIWDLSEFLIQNKITFTYIPPSLLPEVSKILSQRKEDVHLNKLLVGVEPIKDYVLDEYLKINPDMKIINGYGPTEATICATFFSYQSKNSSGAIVPIGKPLKNTKVYILDSYNNLVPVGVPGELCIEGDCIAKGYLNSDELTKDKFVKNKYNNDSLLYKTGDQAMWLESGDIKFIGRKDEQIKIRGFRVELGEIENILSTYPDIDSSVVVVKKSSKEEKFIVAYYVSSKELKLDDIKGYLNSKLPNYMIPSFFIPLETIPLTSNGKINKRALPEPEMSLTSDRVYVEPRTELEITLANIWQDILEVEKIGIEDNFFELGGNSLRAISLAGRIGQELDLHMDLNTLFNNQTIAELAVEFNNNTNKSLSLPEFQENIQDAFEPFPLTDVQQAYWIGRSDIYELGNVGTHGYSEIYIPEIDIDRFNKALNSLIIRHDMLRMVITTSGEQRILEKVKPYSVKVHDFRNVSKDQERDNFLKIRDELSHQKFTGLVWPLFDIRATIFRDGTYKLHYSIDALLMDGTSNEIFFNELIEIYKDSDKKLPELNISFRDYVITEQKIKESEIYNKSKNYWLNRIYNLPEKPDLPLAMSPGEILNPQFNRKEFYLDKTTWLKLEKRIKSEGITPTIFFIELFGNIINKWSKTDHFLLNLTLFNRIPLHEDINKILGDFTSLTILEMDYKEVKSFSEGLKSTQSQLWDDLENRYFSGVEVQREISRVTGNTVTIPVVVTSTLGISNDNSEEVNSIELPELKKEFSITQTSQVWLDYKILDYKGGIGIHWDFVEGLFPKMMLNQMFKSFSTLLAHYAKDDSDWSKKVGELVPENQLSIRLEANNTAGDFSTKYMHELFVDSVLKNGKKVAVKSTIKTLTYSELYSYSTALGRDLGTVGVKPNELIAILMHKGWEQIVGTLGIQFSGAAYMPIDASLPTERINKLIEIGEVTKIVTVSSVIDGFKFEKDLNLFCIDKLNFSDVKTGKITFTAKQKITDLAYIIFTSGSTGEPKGVMIDHRGAVNTILDIIKRFNITDKDSCFALSSLSFDLSVYDIFGMLASGGTVVIPEAEEGKDPAAWLKYLKEDNVTVWNSVPALMQMFTEYWGESETGLGLEKVLLSGDWIPVSLPDQIKTMNPKADVISLGGATEASIWSICYPIDSVDPGWKSIPYGKPLLNQSFHVLKKDLTHCPEWVAGDLYIGGIGLALGYWKDKEKTDSSFIIHPETGERLYRTGDQGRYLPDGNIEFLGRDDSQVKVQGYRIELGEIEEALKGHQMIDSAVVDARSFNSIRGNGKQLVAYIKPKEEDNDNVGGLASAGNSITDKAERTAFKLEKHSILNFSSDSILLADQTETLSLGVNKEFEFTNNKLSYETFSEIFKCLKCKKIDEQPLPKYFYPSAGSLYPVQTYVFIPGDFIDGINSGYYYFNPEENKLYVTDTFQNTQLENNKFKIFLVGDLDAIEPLYGKFSEEFCYMEAGYISSLLLDSSPIDIGIEEIEIDSSVSKNFKLTKKQQILTSFICGSAKRDKKSVRISQSYIERKSYRNFVNEVILAESFKNMIDTLACINSGSLEILVSIKSDRITAYKGGLYKLCKASFELTKVDNEHNYFTLLAGSENIYHESAFGIYLVGEESKENAYISGIIGQSLMNVSTKNSIGLCAIGIVNQIVAKDLFSLDSNNYVIHTFLGGYVTDEQISTLSPVVEKQDPYSILKNYLVEILPNYMVPSYFVIINKVPLTSNGKVNRKVLPDPDTLTTTNNVEFVEAVGDVESKLVSIWKEVLGLERVGVMDNFFESGGNSLTAITLISKIDKEMGVKFTLPILFKHPTIREIAKEFSNTKGKEISLPELIVDKENLYKNFPMTDVQQAYWIGRGDHYDLGGVGTHSYHEMYFKNIDVDRLEYSINYLIQRHEMLRMVVTSDGKQRFLNDDTYYKIQVLDLQNTTEENEKKEFLELRNKLSHQLFTGETWPLFDYRIVKFRDGSFKLLSSIDSLVFDVSSGIIFWNELANVYMENENSLPKLDLNFRDYMMTEYALRETEIFDNSKKYWLDRVDTLPLGPDLPLKCSPKEIEETKFTKQRIILDRNVWEPLKDKIQNIGVTPTVFLTECFGEILRTWSKSDHFLINMTLFNRIPFHKDVNAVLGDFTSLTLLEMDYREDKSFKERLEAVQGQLWEDLEHKYFSGVEVQRSMSSVAGETITIPVVITSTLGVGDIQENNFDELKIDENSLSEIQKNYSISQTPQVWIDCQIGEVNGALQIDWDSVAELFEDNMLKEMFKALEELLLYYGNENSDWHQRVIDLTPQKQLDIRNNANNTAGNISTKYMHELFVDSVLKDGNKVAVKTTNKTLTYSELYNYSAALGKDLETACAKPNELVAILMHKGWEQVVATLGIQFSGAAYMPIDASLPIERINKLIEIGDVTKIVSVSSVLEGLTLEKEVDLFCVDKLNLTKINQEEITFITKQTLEDLAYIIFTSGSTGEPKGVMIDHRGAVNTILDINNRFNITEKDSCFALSSLSFDLSVYDIFGLLAAGGTVVIPESEEGKDPAEWLKYLKEDCITVWNSVPALMQMLVEYTGEIETGLNLEKVLLSGDWIPVSLPDQIRAINPKANVISLGGATEASIWSICYPIDSVDPGWKSIPYGKPLLNQSFHVLKKDLTHCPEWVAGDLYIGGIGLALGYWKDKEKTDSSFISHPESGERLYRTGDQGRYLSDGNIEFLGRDDSQVKVQGYRIELGEIEEALKGHQMIDNAVVDAKSIGKNKGNNNGKQLIAYIIPKKVDSDNVGGLASAENSITDKVERTAFKLEKRGILKLSSESIALNKQGDEISLSSNDSFEFTGKRLSFNSFCSVFSCLLNKTFDEKPLPKYYYPSAGNLYPVQTYISIPENSVDSMEPGYYYFNPEENRLYLCNSPDKDLDNISIVGFNIYLIADLDAIEPLYGKYGEDFSYMEAGYMAQLLTNSVPKGVGLEQTEIRDGINKCFNLKENHRFITAYKCGSAEVSSNSESNSIYRTLEGASNNVFGVKLECTEENDIKQTLIERKSYRNFCKEIINFNSFSYMINSILINQIVSLSEKDKIDFYITVKNGRIEDLQGGIYQLDPVKMELIKHSEESDLYTLLSGSEGIYQESGFGMFIVGAESKQGMYASGVIGQTLMNVSTKVNIGLCAIGIVNQAEGRKIFNLDENDSILHSFLGGFVADEQINKLSQELEVKDPTQLLKDYLGGILPDYMVPSYFVTIDSIPLTANGKVNRKSLPEIQGNLGSNNEYTPASNCIEEELVRIWEKVLGIKRVGVHDNFFELGGSSIKGVEIISELEKVGLKSSLTSLIKNPTIFEFSLSISYAKHKVDQSTVVGTQSVIFPQVKILDNAQKVESSAILNFSNEINTDLLYESCKKVIEHHDALRMIYKKIDKKWIMENRESIGFNFESVSDSNLINFKLSQSNNCNQLIITANNLVIDSYSWSIIINDVELGYLQLRNNKDIKLPPKTDSYLSWIGNQFDIEREVILNKVDFWKNVKYRENSNYSHIQTSEEITTSTFEFSSDYTSKLLKDVHSTLLTTIDDIMLSSITKVLSEFLESKIINVNFTPNREIFNIEELDFTRTVGGFCNQYPITLSNKSNSTDEFILSIKEQLKEYYSNIIGYNLCNYQNLGNIKPNIDVEYSFFGTYDHKSKSDIFSVEIKNANKPIGNLDIDCFIKNGRFVTTLSSKLYDSKDITEISNKLKHEVERIVSFCINKKENDLVLFETKNSKLLNVKPIQFSLYCLEDATLTLLDSSKVDYQYMFLSSFSFGYDISNETKKLGDKIFPLSDEHNLLEKYHGVRIPEFTKANEEESLLKIKEEIDRNKPVLLLFETYFAPWSASYGVELGGAGHPIIASGYNDEKNILYCTETEHLKEACELSYENLHKGLLGYSTVEGDVNNVILKAYEALKILIDYNYISKSLDNIKSFAKDVKNNLDIEEEMKNNDDPEPLMTPIHFNFYVSLYRTRKNLITLFKFLYKENPTDFFKGLIDYTEDLVEQWQLVRVFILKMVHGVYPKNYREILSNMILNMVNKEEEFFNIINRNLNNKDILNWDINNLEKSSSILKSDKVKCPDFNSVSRLDIDEHFCNNGIGTTIDSESPSNLCGVGYYIYMPEAKEKSIWTKNSLSFEFPKIEDEYNDNISCMAQVINVDKGDFSHISILGCAEWGNFVDNMKIKYIDGTSQLINIEMEDRYQIKKNIDEIMWLGDSVDNSNESEFDYAVKGKNICLRATVYKLNSKKTISSITLPNSPSMHIFSITLGVE